MAHLLYLLFSLVITALACTSAVADLVMAPQAVIRNDLGTWISPGHEIDKAIDQSGLTSNYVSGVTDLQDYLSLDPKHVSRIGNNDPTAFVSNNGTPVGVIDFDLGEITSVNSFVFWQSFYIPEAVVDFTLSTSNLPDFSVSTEVGSFSASPPPGSGSGQIGVATEFQFFDVIDSEARYVRLHIQSNVGDRPYTEIGELAFGVSPIPEASSFFCLGLITAAAAACWSHRWRYRDHSGADSVLDSRVGVIHGC